jgi:hypothetical protein
MNKFYRDSLLGFGNHAGKTIERIYVGDENLSQDEELNLVKHAINKSGIRENKYNFELKLPDSKSVSMTGNFLSKNYLDKGQIVVLNKSGFPEYIQWCLFNIDYFVMNESELNYMESLEYISFPLLNIIALEWEEGGLYSIEYDVVIKRNNYKFSDFVREANLQKFKMNNK